MLPVSSSTASRGVKRGRRKQSLLPFILCGLFICLVVVLCVVYIAFMISIVRNGRETEIADDEALKDRLRQVQPQEQEIPHVIYPPIDREAVEKFVREAEKASPPTEEKTDELPTGKLEKLQYQSNFDAFTQVLNAPGKVTQESITRVNPTLRNMQAQRAQQDASRETGMLSSYLEKFANIESPTTEKYPIESLLHLGYSKPSDTSFNLLAFNDMDEALSSYTAFHKKNRQLIDQRNSRNVPILVVTPREGWGNMVRAVTSSLYVAMITGRVMLINMDWSRYFQPNENHPDWRLPSNTLVDSCYTYRIDKCPTCDRSRELMRTVPLKKLLPESAHCINMVLFSPLQEWLLENPSTKGIMNRMLSEKSWQSIYQLFNVHTPSQLIEDKIAPVYKHFEGNTVFGFQIRTGVVDTRAQRRSEPRFIRYETVARLLLCAKRLVSHSKTENVKIYLATDHPGVTAMFQKEFERSGGDTTLLFLPATQSFMEHSMYNADNLDSVVSEWVLLSRTSTIFGSYLSSFVETSRFANRVPVYWVATPAQKAINSLPFHTSIPPICANLFPLIPTLLS